ncbi:MAG: sensor histidine kinase [Planctomycetota bacterium]
MIHRFQRPWQIWLVFALCVTVLLGALGWTSVTVMHLERSGIEAARTAETEEAVRLALWRMDSTLTPLLARENGRPYFAFTAFCPAERAYTRMFNELERGEVLVPSPLLVEMPELVQLHFQIDADGRFTSPQAPEGNMRDLAEAGYTTHEAICEAHERLQQLAARINGSLGSKSLVLALPAADSPHGALAPVRIPDVVDLAANNNPALNGNNGNNDYNSWTESQNYRGVQRSQAEYGARAQQLNRQMPDRNLENQSNIIQKNSNGLPEGNEQGGPGAANVDDTPAPGHVSEGRMRPMWIGDDVLVLARRVKIDDREFVQGCWLDWPAVRQQLVNSVTDLLPGADLQPWSQPMEGAPWERMLTVLPAQLHPGQVPVTEAPDLTPASMTLIIAWAGVLLAAIAVAMLLSGTLSLSERRASFVSAVTHEMRTPLTTFRLYSDMLASGRVTDDAKKSRYLGTLCSEAGRLSHLVENVLAWARLERGRKGDQLEPVEVGTLLDNAVTPLRERALRSGLELTVDVPDAARVAMIRASAPTVDQILFNLVENACKYATPTERAGTTDRRLELSARVSSDSRLELVMRDHGPGIDAADHRHLFQPFRKSSTRAVDTTPGVGLGLALSRRLARGMGGELAHDRAVTDGAAFVLSFPIA